MAATTTDLALTGAGISPETLEALVVGGDLAKLNPAQRIEVYKAKCDAAGLDYRTQPLQYITLQNKLTLYATKAATDQLISHRGLTVEIVDRRVERELGIYEAHCRVVRPNGTHVDDFASVSIAGLKGDALCNATMKAVTKAKRRTVLSACGLGMLNESEAETIPNARHVSVDRDTGEIMGGAAPAPDTWRPSEAQLRRLYAIAKANGHKGKEDLRVFMAGIPSFPEKEGQLSREQYDELCARLEGTFEEAIDADFEEVA